MGREAAEDYVQDAFMTVIRHIEDLKKANNKRRYLNQALKNVIAYRLRVNERAFESMQPR